VSHTAENFWVSVTDFLFMIELLQNCGCSLCQG
jgi:hypothetical protein